MTIGLFLTALGLGLRHGIVWDHIAAIADLSGNAENRKRGFVLSMLYAVGHGIVVFVLGIGAIAFGLAIPDSLDAWMGRLVGVTLIFLGGWILIELLRKGQDFRLRSRWMLVIDGTFSGLRRVRNGLGGRKISVEHEHSHEHNHDHDVIDLRDDADAAIAHDHSHLVELHEAEVLTPEPALTAVESANTTEAGWRGFRSQLREHGHSHPHTHSHSHKHDLALPDQPDASYGHRAATGIGMLHGVGVESPTQIAIFAASTTAIGVGAGVAILAAWVGGLIIANAVLALFAGAGLLNAEKSFPVYAAVAVVVSVLSIALGTLYVLGLDILPAIT